MTYQLGDTERDEELQKEEELGKQVARRVLPGSRRLHTLAESGRSHAAASSSCTEAKAGDYVVVQVTEACEPSGQSFVENCAKGLC